MVHRILAVLTALALSMLLVAPALAGGWAEIVADKATEGATDDPPRAGETISIGFFVMQHGETPAPWEGPTVHFTDVETGEVTNVRAVSDGPDGHFTATTTAMRAGYLTWQVTLRDLASEHQPQMLVVHTGTGAAPAFDPASAMLAIQRTRQNITAELETRYLEDIGRLEATIESQGRRITALDRELEAAQAGGGTGSATTAGAGTGTGDGPGSIPPLGVITLAVLAGATAGFLTAWLAGRPGPTVTLSPAPREPDPA